MRKMKERPGSLTYSVPEGARKIGVSDNTMYEAIKRNEIPHIRIGKCVRIPKAALDRMLAGDKAA
jgi:excisionase family DNA binding protein